MNRPRWCCVGVAALVFLAGLEALAAPCTITVQPGESIQAAIDAASPGDVICLSPGEWEENLVIEKSLTLRAAQVESEPLAVIRSAREGWPVIRIESEEPIDVTIQGLRVRGAFGPCYKEAPEWICAYGISVHGKVTATIDNNTISGNGRFDILMLASSQATITDNVIRDNERHGVALWELPCIDTDRVFTGYVTGEGNTGGENAWGDYCPADLAFLFTEEGGELDRREEE